MRKNFFLFSLFAYSVNDVEREFSFDVFLSPPRYLFLSRSHSTKIVFRVSNLHCELSTCSLFKQHFTFLAHFPSHKYINIIDVSSATLSLTHSLTQIEEYKNPQFFSLFIFRRHRVCMKIPPSIPQGATSNTLLREIHFLVKTHTFYYRSFAL